MYKIFTWFTIGYLFHKHGVPITLRALEDLKRASEQPNVDGSSEPLKFGGTFDSMQEIRFVDRDHAAAFLGKMNSIIETSGHASVNDLHAIIGLPTNHAYEQVGWTSRLPVEVRRTSDNSAPYLVTLPVPVEL